MIAVILAGGKGSRLLELTKDEIPKPMVLFCGKPILQHTIEKLKENGINEFVITINHLGNKIIDFFNDGQKFGVKIEYISEDVALGSAGALYFLKDKIKDKDFVVCSGDVIFDINLEKMLQFHKKNKADLTMFTHPNLHPYDSDLVLCDKFGKVEKLDLKGSKRDFFYTNNVNAGFFIIGTHTLDYFTEIKKVNMEKDFIKSLVENGKNIFSYKSPEYIKDVGTAERFQKATKDMQNGIIALKNLKNKQKAIFLDRDGTLNKYKNFISRADQIELVEDAVEAVGLINQSEYLAIVVTNQPVIARGEATFEDVEEMHKKIETLLGEKGVYLEEFYYCPHHPHSGYEGEVKELKFDCDCRKPKLGLIKRAEKDFNLDLEKCFIIGDSFRDIQTGRNAKMLAIKIDSDLVETQTVVSDYQATSLLDAVKFILKK